MDWSQCNIFKSFSDINKFLVLAIICCYTFPFQSVLSLIFPSPARHQFYLLDPRSEGPMKHSLYDCSLVCLFVHLFEVRVSSNLKSDGDRFFGKNLVGFLVQKVQNGFKIRFSKFFEKSICGIFPIFCLNWPKWFLREKSFFWCFLVYVAPEQGFSSFMKNWHSGFSVFFFFFFFFFFFLHQVTAAYRL